MLKKDKVRIIKYSVAIAIILIFIYALYYPYSRINKHNATNISSVQFYMGDSTDLFFKNKNYVSDFMDSYQKFEQFRSQLESKLKTEEDASYSSNEKILRNLKFSYPKEYFDENSILVFLMHGEKGEKIQTKLINVDFNGKTADITCEMTIPEGQEGVGQEGKYNYVLYFIPIKGKSLTNVKIRNPKYTNLDILKMEIAIMPIVIYIVLITYYVLKRKKLKELSGSTDFKKSSRTNTIIFSVGMVLNTIYLAGVLTYIYLNYWK